VTWDDEDEIPADEQAEEGLSRLVAVERLGARLPQLPWFIHVGQPLLDEERDLARQYLDALGFSDAELVLVQSWEDAAFAAENPGFDTAWWDTEEQLRSALTGEALALLDQTELQIALTRLGDRAATGAKRGMREAAALASLGDDALSNAAIGAAVQAAHQRALVVAAGADAEHAFVPKFALFEHGRWPIAVVGGTFHLF
jgi:hypothetical protein